MIFTRHLAKEDEGRSMAEILALLDGRGFTISDSGAYVNEHVALSQATVWACVRILSESIAQLPVIVQQLNGGKWIDIEHDVLGLLAAPNKFQTGHDYTANQVAWTELRGNAYSLRTVVRGRVRELLPLQSDEVEVMQRDDWSLSYRWNGEDIPADQIMHMRNFSLSGFKGLSTIAAQRNTIGLALSMEKHGAGIFKRGATLGLVMETEGTLEDGQIERLKKQLETRFSGADNAHRTLILEGGLKSKPMGMTNNDTQWLEARKLSKSEIATIFGIPDFMLNSTEKSTTWGSGLEQLSRAFVRYTLQPRMSRIRQTYRRDLLTDAERGRMRFRHDTDAMTMGDYESRMTGHSTAINAGILNPDEAREKEGMNARADGEGGEYWKPLNMAEPDETDNQTPD